MSKKSGPGRDHQVSQTSTILTRPSGMMGKKRLHYTVVTTMMHPGPFNYDGAGTSIRGVKANQHDRRLDLWPR